VPPVLNCVGEFVRFNWVTETAVKIVLNGQDQQLPAPLTVAQLLTQLQMPQRGVAVEVNEQIVPRSLHEQHLLQNGDRLEIVSLVGGG
jgi:sulfur carrier protein